MEGLLIVLVLLVVLVVPLVALTVAFRTSNRLREVERQVDALRRGVNVPAPATRPLEEPTSPVSTPSFEPAPSFSAAPPKRDWEDLLGGSVLNRLGAVAIVVAAVFLLHLSFERGWAAPAGPLALGFLEAATLVGWGAWLSRRGDRLFGQGLAGAGIAVAFATVHVSHGVHGAMGSWVALFVLLATALVGAWIAVVMRSQAVAWIALLGGYLAPLLVGASGGVWTLVVYVAALSTLALTLGDRKGWRGLDAVAVVGAQVVWISWLDELKKGTPLGPTLLGLEASYLVFLLAPLLRRWARGRPLRSEDLALWGAAGVALLVWTGWVLHGHDRAGHGWVAVQLAVVHLGLALVARGRSDESDRTEQTLLALSLVFLVVAVPLEFDGLAVTLLWTGHGVVLAFLAAQTRRAWLAWSTVGAMFIALGHTVFFDLDELSRHGSTGPDPRALLLLATPLGCGVAAWIAQRHDLRVPLGVDRSMPVARWIAVPAGIVTSLILAVELTQHPWRAALPEVDWSTSTEEERQAFRAAAQDRERWGLTAVSVAWALQGAASVALGFARSWKAVRWFGVVLLLVVAAKGVIVDLSGLATGYRVAVFLALGVLLLAASRLYSRRRRMADAAGSGSE